MDRPPLSGPKGFESGAEFDRLEPVKPRPAETGFVSLGAPGSGSGSWRSGWLGRARPRRLGSEWPARLPFEGPGPARPEFGRFGRRKSDRRWLNSSSPVSSRRPSSRIDLAGKFLAKRWPGPVRRRSAGQRPDRSAGCIRPWVRRLEPWAGSVAWPASPPTGPRATVRSRSTRRRWAPRPEMGRRSRWWFRRPRLRHPSPRPFPSSPRQQSRRPRTTMRSRTGRSNWSSRGPRRC